MRPNRIVPRWYAIPDEATGDTGAKRALARLLKSKSYIRDTRRTLSFRSRRRFRGIWVFFRGGGGRGGATYGVGVPAAGRRSWAGGLNAALRQR